MYSDLLYHRYCILSVLILAVTLAGCAPQYANPHLEWNAVPAPEDDFRRVLTFFRANQGELLVPGEREITYKDTTLFRIYELKSVTVVVFPYNWSKERHSFIVFAGRLPEDKDPFAALQFKNAYTPKPRQWNDTIEWTLREQPELTRIQWEGFKLGETAQATRDTMRAYVMRHTHPTNHSWAVGLLDFATDTSILYTKTSEIQFYYVDGRAAYMRVTNKDRGVPLALYSIDKPVTPVIRQGKFICDGATKSSR